jgi:hypothetical protein
VVRLRKPTVREQQRLSAHCRREARSVVHVDKRRDQKDGHKRDA